MKDKLLRILPLAFGLVFLLSLPVAFAADKIGIVDVREVMQNSTEGKKASEEFKKIFEKNKAQISAKEAELKKLKEDLEKQRSVLKEAALKEKEGAYQKKFRDYQIMVKDANEELQARDQELSKSMLPEIIKVISAIGAKEKYTVILDIGTMPVPYFSKENDLTKRVIEEFNQTYKPKK
ncbi:periplasmic chaperone for outer membrane proteins Skp [Syntrophus gentianae]|uniref:Periplasmic chaperone for outer membrane proteins Skp n=1 Tax=Syntrophus gentianae TaxID=43775 RepID=A0A1H7W9E9_9BACT|nr:OmpH family outer membrane protein [Syntrophus gentianae]SEM18133.1 periplasmic chaperone for outer membrane proteins Skp [Syntrophus gentianae]